MFFYRGSDDKGEVDGMEVNERLRVFDINNSKITQQRLGVIWVHNMDNLDDTISSCWHFIFFKFIFVMMCSVLS
jgi:hypothetical protein